MSRYRAKLQLLPHEAMIVAILRQRNGQWVSPIELGVVCDRSRTQVQTMVRNIRGKFGYDCIEGKQGRNGGYRIPPRKQDRT